MPNMDYIPAAWRPFFHIYGHVVPKTEKWMLTRNGFDPVKRHELHARHALKEKLVLDVQEVMSQNDPRYEYTGLGPREFRMLQIHPAPSRTDPISCSLLTWSIDDLPAPFEALSYTWGDAKERHWITIDGKAIDVTPNLISALQQFRQPDQDRLLWVDALCINQQDLPERGSQVLFMDLVYKRAARVVVWLGVAYSQSHLAFELMTKITGVMEADRKAHSDSNSGGEMYRKYTMEQDVVERGLPEQDDPAWLALDALFWRQWFLRIWVVQEVAVPKVALVVCGSDTIDFDAFCDLCDYLHNTALGSRTGLSADRVLALRTARSQYQTNNHASLVTQLISSRTCLATNAADKVFAMLNISKDVPPDPALRPDYHKSPSTVFSDTARVLLAQSLDILNFNSDSVWRVHPDMPSWAPDWSCAPREFCFLFTPEGPWLHAGTVAGDSSAPNIRFSEDNKVLHLQGRILDKITTVGESHFMFSHARYGQVSNDWYSKKIDKDEFLYRFSRHRRWTMWEHMALKLKSYPVTGEDIRTAFQKTLIANANFPPREMGGKLEPVNLEELYTAFRRLQSVEPHLGQDKMTEDDIRIQKDNHDLYGQKVRAAAYGRKIFVTKKGYLGLAPVSAATGYFVAILHGGRTAYVLKKKKNGNYSFVGEAYLHGFMHGQALDDEKYPVEELAIE
ncbi:uncharacterized protein SPSK_05058 [Sporothrix schenckii 1099-18]|uniref:Heterokaryon incompatibility domain-containing protein n=1 Tax=Sporothrix schenckii 1099-18 TaxID=1397361 RepID=A0A0F2LUL7_SPOSC|nr:uncharacterized protein SPSK_05058 [Sporothrix schenckii 1099-18]KJR81168.1 hypothetical protein SPSK_05058 [Sporothrix schenckii 1099-18]